jgi:hypothetical protein
VQVCPATTVAVLPDVVKRRVQLAPASPPAEETEMVPLLLATTVSVVVALVFTVVVPDDVVTLADSVTVQEYVPAHVAGESEEQLTTPAAAMPATSAVNRT